MMEKDFKLCIEGEGAEEVAKELTALLEREFDQRAREMLLQKGPGKKGEKADPLAVAAFILALPAAALAAWDLVERLRMKKKVDLLIQWSKKHPGQITIITPSGNAIRLDTAGSGEILEAAEEAVPLQEKGEKR